jgi:arginyl-tRNA synthetase
MNPTTIDSGTIDSGANEGRASDASANGAAAASGLERIARAFERAAAELVPGEAPPPAVFEAPRNPEFGDFACNIALRLAKRARRAPQTLANELIARSRALDAGLDDIAQAVATSGFINIRLAPRYWQGVVADILRDGAGYGRVQRPSDESARRPSDESAQRSSDERAERPSGESVSLEFGSANPTGPVVVVQGRTLSLGDALAKAMRFCGIRVTTEWIVNDAGSQIDTLGRSLYARYRQLADPAFPFPAEGYPGEYLVPIAREIRERAGAAYDDAPETEWLPFFASTGLEAMVKSQQATCERFGVHFDRWQSEQELHVSGAVTRGVSELRERGLTFEQDGATWMRTTQFGDDKDRVLIRSDGRPTYYAPDVAYHHDKLQRNDRALLILGPDHHGYILRLQTIAAAFGKPGAIDVLIAQQMTTLRDGAVVSLSKRHGDVLTLDDVIDEVGVDAARFFFVMPNPDSPMTFDLTLAKAQTNDNPVYYVQYGHARIASIERNAPAAILERARRGEGLERLGQPEELALARRLEEFPAVVRSVVTSLAPSRLARYAQQVASDYTQFYMSSRVLGEDADLSAGRLGLCLATKTVLAQSLGLLGVSAPEKM